MDSLAPYKNKMSHVFAVVVSKQCCLVVVIYMNDTQMSDVKRVGERLECMLFRARFKEEVDELKPVRHEQYM